MIPEAHQERGSHEAYAILKKYGMVYIGWHERTGKTLTALGACELMKAERFLICTKKEIVPNWINDIKACDWITKQYKICNYEQILRYAGFAQVVLLDEPHAMLTSYPIQRVRQKQVKAVCYKCPVIYIGATPAAQGYHNLWGQFSVCYFSPWRRLFKTGYDFYRFYVDRAENGLNPTKYGAGGEEVPDYTALKHDRIKRDTRHLFLTLTRKESGHIYEPEDVIHYVELEPATKKAYNTLMTKKVLRFTAGGVERRLVLDSVMKSSSALHMLEGGGLKVGNEHIVIKPNEKIDYIKKVWGDTEDMAIMYNYISEGEKLNQQFSKALILQGTRYAEGIDLSHIKHLIIYSQDFSTARHSQRRARQANRNRTEPIKVHFLLVKQAVSEQVYKTVAENKVNFVDSLFIRTKL